MIRVQKIAATKITVLLACAVSLAGVVMTGCNKPSSSNELLLYICDAPANYDKLDFSIAAVAAHASASDEWVPMPMINPSVSLLTLVGGAMQKISAAKLPSGSYDALRITVKPTASLVVGGVQHPMAVGLEPFVIPLPTPIAIDGEKQTVLLDYDAAASVVETIVGDVTEYSFVPSVRVIYPDEVGSLRAGVANDKGAAIGRALLVTFEPVDQSGGKPTVYSTYADVKGSLFIRIPAGVYTMTIHSPAALPLEPWSRQVSVELGRATNMGMIVVTAIPKS